MKALSISLLLLLGVVLTLAADILLQRSDFINLKYFLPGIVLYGSVAIPVAALFRLVPFGNLFIIWEAGYLVLGILTAAVLYNEPLTLHRLLALALALAALGLSYA